MGSPGPETPSSITMSKLRSSLLLLALCLLLTQAQIFSRDMKYLTPYSDAMDNPRYNGLVRRAMNDFFRTSKRGMMSPEFRSSWYLRYLENLAKNDNEMNSIN